MERLMKFYCSEQDSSSVDEIIKQFNNQNNEFQIRRQTVIGQDISTVNNLITQAFSVAAPIVMYAITINKVDDIIALIKSLAELFKSTKSEIVIKKDLEGNEYINISNASQKNLEKIIEKAIKK